MPEYLITGRACGEFSMIVEADDDQDAREQAETLAERGKHMAEWRQAGRRT